MIQEHELIERAQAGDQEAFCLLARSYQRRIYALALHYTRDPYEAEDLSQEVWLKAYRALSGFRGEAGFYTCLRKPAGETHSDKVGTNRARCLLIEVTDE